MVQMPATEVPEAIPALPSPTSQAMVSGNRLLDSAILRKTPVKNTFLWTVPEQSVNLSNSALGFSVV